MLVTPGPGWLVIFSGTDAAGGGVCVGAAINGSDEQQVRTLKDSVLRSRKTVRPIRHETHTFPRKITSQPGPGVTSITAPLPGA